MRRLSRPPRLATLCVQGTTADRTIDNATRVKLLNAVALALQQRDEWHPLDGLVLPGGFFWMSRALGATAFDRRQERLGKERFSSSIYAALQALEAESPGIRLITGVMARPRDGRERIEQASLAFDRHGLVGAARKIFPTMTESRGRRFMTPYSADYASEARFVKLSNGSLAALHSCYDLFGTADIGSAGDARRAAIRLIRTDRRRIVESDEEFAETRRACLAAWAGNVTQRKPDVLLATIHGFERPGLDGYWQRHGIARASAAHGGAFALGAAHFATGLPSAGSTLAACRVPKHELTAGVRRKAHSLQPRDSVQVITAGLSGILRLFEPRLVTGKDLLGRMK